MDSNKFEHLKEFVAHRRDDDGEIQGLWSHLFGVACLSGEFASKIGLEKHGKVAGLLHDLGKATEVFNNYIKSATGLIDPDEDDYVDYKGKKGKIDHSTAGAQYIYQIFNRKGKEYKLLTQILSIVIASHHSGLIDCMTCDGVDNYTTRMNKSDDLTGTSKAIKKLNKDIKSQVDTILSDINLNGELLNIIRSLKDSYDQGYSAMFKVGLLTRFLFSCVIDADRLDTADFEFPDNKHIRNYSNYINWDILIEKLEEHIKKFSCSNDVNKLRKEISDSCLAFASKPKGVYKLTVPTGGGKTLSSLRFALNHAKKYSMDRIFYIIPFTSIIDQNAETAREIFEEKTSKNVYKNSIVLEHHSNLTPDEENTRQKLLSENWDAPVVFTTMVQFLETLFGSGTRDARRMHQLANSVIIFDEIQTLPIKCVHMFNVAIRFFVKSCNSTVVLCTATQPLLDEVKPEERSLNISDGQEIMPNVKKLFNELKRVEVYNECKNSKWNESEIAQLVEEELKETGSVLIIVNTKKSASNLFIKVQHLKTKSKIFHLSTNMCAEHRMNILKEVRKCLTDKAPVICVSTQLIEAGVDVDFGSVIRYIAGLDSIAQAAGRCNRNGIRPKTGKVIVVNPKDENLDKLKEIRIGINMTERIFSEFQKNPVQFGEDILGVEAIKRYYKYYFYERTGEMSYNVNSNSIVGRDDNLFELLSVNSNSIAAYRRSNEDKNPDIAILHSYRTASKAFHAIDSVTRGVIVPYDDGKEIIYDLCQVQDLQNQYRLLKKAQRYTVNLYQYLFDKLIKNEIIFETQNGSGVYYLDKQYYSEEFGISESIVNDMEFANA